jgi:hypothetical protein
VVVPSTVYLETSVVSYLVARPSRDLVTTAHQQLTTEWWLERRARFAVYVSELVLREAAAGDEDAARRRLAALEGIPLLAMTTEALQLARHLVEEGAIPAPAAADAAHVALATAHGMEYLLTWNCRHIANAEMRLRIERACRARGFEPPALCTPEELMGE